VSTAAAAGSGARPPAAPVAGAPERPAAPRRIHAAAAHARVRRLESALWAERRGRGGWLAPAGALAGAGAAARGALAHASRARLARPVVSVGGLSAGGAGKTPVARLLAATLTARGARVAVLTRGHPLVGRADPPLVILPPAESGTAGGGRPPRELPDEALLFARDGIPVGAHPVRARAAAALARAGVVPDVYLLDDGFGHRSLERDLDLVVLSWRDLHAAPRPFPAGPFREGWESLRRARRIVIAGLDASRAAALEAGAAPVPQLPGGEPPLLAVLDAGPAVELHAWRAGEAGPAVAPREATAFSGIADPAAFESTLLAAGWRVAAHLVFPDHHRFAADDLRRAAELRPREGLLVTTEKDAARLPPGAFPPGACAVLPVRARLVRGGELLAGDLDRLQGGAR
jgi:tetraacyldisaccharide 4'-kinase